MTTDWVRKYLSSKYKNAVMSNLAKKSHKPSSRRAKRKGGPLAGRCPADESRPSESSRPESAVSTPTPQPSKFATETEKTTVTKDRRLKYIEGMQLWFIPPSNPVMTALYHYCIEKEVHWHVAVLRFLRKGLVEEGYLDKEESEMAETG